MIEKILNLYQEYDKGLLESKDAANYIANLFLEEHPEQSEIINEIINRDNDAVLIEIMSIIENIYPYIYE